MTIKIIDLYSGNTPNFLGMVEDGYTGVIYKGGQGQLADVPRIHPEWWEEARGYGLDRGWYWLKDARQRPSLEVEALKRATNLDFGELGLWVDAEKPVRTMKDTDYWLCPYSGYGPLYDFMYQVQMTGASCFPAHMPGLYTSPGFWKLISQRMTTLTAEWFAQALLWTAQYPWVYLPGVSKPTMYGAWQKWTLWQYQEGPDINIFNGSDEEYASLFGGVVVEPPVGETMDYKVVWANGCAERLGAGISYSSTGTVYSVGSVVKIVSVTAKTAGYEEWGKLENGRYIATVYSGSPRAVLVAAPPPPGDNVIVDFTARINGVSYSAHDIVLIKDA